MNTNLNSIDRFSFQPTDLFQCIMEYVIDPLVLTSVSKRVRYKIMNDFKWKYLNLSNYPNITDFNIGNFCSYTNILRIEQVNLQGCSKITLIGLKSLLDRLEHIKFLDIRFCNGIKLNQAFVTTIRKYIKEHKSLKTLKLFGIQGISEELDDNVVNNAMCCNNTSNSIYKELKGIVNIDIDVCNTKYPTHYYALCISCSNSWCVPHNFSSSAIPCTFCLSYLCENCVKYSNLILTCGDCGESYCKSCENIVSRGCEECNRN